MIGALSPYSFDRKARILQENKTKTFATISDVASYAKVGKTSVSRYLNGELHKLSPTLKAKIADAIKQLNYQPNQSARMLKAGQSKLIGLLLADITNPYSVELMQSIERTCRLHGYMLMVCNTDNSLEQQERYLALLKAHRVDGIIINPLGMNSDSFLALKPIDCPFVLLDRANKQLDVDCIGVDNHQAALLACEHLYDNGFQSILIVTQPLDVTPRRLRVETIQAFVSTHPQLKLNTTEIEIADDEKLVEPLTQFVRSNDNLKKAILCINGVCALSTAKILRQLNVGVGSDVGLVCIDDPAWAQVVSGGITAVRQPLKEIGEKACERLLLQMNEVKSTVQDIQLPAQLVIRNSTQF